ncbi:hypothetical protein MP228_012486 [Amoeboaphelidium protococcarum]|nr:hypothetical protein MP228_012486 [Amoeboaphelidium protococcarum]
MSKSLQALFGLMPDTLLTDQQQSYPIQVQSQSGMITTSQQEMEMSQYYIKIDFVLKLPVELAVLILANLGASDLAACLIVSRQWRGVIEHNEEIWRMVCRQHNYRPIQHWRLMMHAQNINQIGQKSITNTAKQRNSAPNTLVLSTSPSLFHSRAPWKKILIENYLTEINWQRGRYIVETAVKQKQQRQQLPPAGVYSEICVQVSSELDRALSVSPISDRPSVAELWDTRSGHPICTLVGHQGIISAVKFGQNGLLVTGGSDCSVKLWKIDDAQCLQTYIGHTKEVECVNFDSTIIVSGSSDHDLRVWDIKSGECISTLTGHTDAVTCVSLDDDYIVSGSCDGSIRVWNREGYDHCETLRLEGRDSKIYCLEMNDSYIIAGGTNKTITVWSRKDLKKVQQLVGHEDDIVTLQVDKDKIVSGSSDKTIKVWSLSQGTLLYSLRKHLAPVWNLRFDGSRIVSSSFDQKVYVWNFGGGEMISEYEKVKWGLTEVID